MASAALQRWLTSRARALDDAETTHRILARAARRPRRAIEQLHHAYVVLLSSHFQGFCRDLHTDAVDHVIGVCSPAALRKILRTGLVASRRLDRGNPNKASLGADFSRLGIWLWAELEAEDRRTVERGDQLEALCRWRNAIAHSDFEGTALVPAALGLQTIRSWRRACGSLAISTDRVLGRYLGGLTNELPW